VKSVNSLLAATGTTIFTVMSALATQHDSINLGQGFPDTDGPADILQAAADALMDQRNQYPPMPGVPELRRAVAAHNARFYGLEIDPMGEVVVTSGATEAITACLMAVLDPGDEVVVIEPVYDTYLPVIRMIGAVPRIVRLSPPAWELPRAELAAAFGPKTKAILLNTPMNPTGKVFTAAELAFIADLVTRHDAFAICDEVYEHLTFDGWHHIPLMTLPGLRERTMRIGSAGKTFSLTGWKIGYVTAPAALAGVVAKAHQNLTFTSAPNLQRAVAVGLAKDEAYFRGLSSALAARRDQLAAGLAGLGLTVLPDGDTAGEGPLAGLRAGLAWAAGLDAEFVLTAPGDTPFLPVGLARSLAPPPSFAARAGVDHPLVALWPVTILDRLRSVLSAPGSRAVVAFAREIGMRRVEFPASGADPFMNVNTPDDLATARAMAENPRWT
jgi:aspartate/methionine/tyrosine aminotransferase